MLYSLKQVTVESVVLSWHSNKLSKNPSEICILTKSQEVHWLMIIKAQQPISEIKMVHSDLFVILVVIGCRMENLS